MVPLMTIGQLAARTGLAVRTLRFYADVGVLPEVRRSESGYRLFESDAVAQARLVRTLRELGVGLDDVRRVLAAEVSLEDVAATHARALDAQIQVLRLQRAVLRAVARSTRPEELERMTGLTTLTVEGRRRILDEYLDAVFGGESSPIADRLRTRAPELPDDPTADEVAAWVELTALLRDPGFVEASRRMAERARAGGAVPDYGHVVAEEVGEHAGAAVRAGVEPGSPEALVVIERLEALAPPGRRRPGADGRAPGGLHRSPRLPVLDARGHRQRLAAVTGGRGLGGRVGVVREGASGARLIAMAVLPSPVPAPTPGATPPPISHAIYGMPMFATLVAADLERTISWYSDGLGFINLFAVPGPSGPALVHLRRWQFQDLLVRPSSEPITPGTGCVLSFAAVLDELDDLALRARAHGAGRVEGPADTAWNTRDLTTVDPDGTVVVFTAGRPHDQSDGAFSERMRAGTTGAAPADGGSSAARPRSRPP